MQKKQVSEENGSSSPKKKRKLDNGDVNIEDEDVHVGRSTSSISGTSSSGSGNCSSGSSYCSQLQDSCSCEPARQSRVNHKESNLQGPRKLSKRLERILRNKPPASLFKKQKHLPLSLNGSIDNVNNVFCCQKSDKFIHVTQKVQNSVNLNVFNSHHGAGEQNCSQACSCTSMQQSFTLKNCDLCIHNHGNTSNCVVNGRPECWSYNSIITDDQDCVERKPVELQLEPSEEYFRDFGHSFPDLSQYVALDCEFVGVGSTKSGAIGRCSIVDFRGEILYDGYAIPDLPITDYRTRWSGIRPRDMKHALPQEVVLKSVKEILEGKIVVGHALFNDFKTLGIRHPRHLIRDTHSYKPLKQRVPASPSLKNLTKNLLGLDIQDGEHCSVEDARAAMKLYLLVRDEWESSLLQKYLKNKKKLDEMNHGQTMISACTSDTSSLTQKSFLDDEFWPEDV